MAAAIERHPGNEAGRVTIVTTLASFIPTIITCGLITAAFLVEMISAEIAAAMYVTALGLGSSTSATVYKTAKKTKTDRADLMWASGPVSDIVTPPPGTPVPEPVVHGDVVADDLASEDDTPAPGSDVDLAAEVAAVRGRHAGSSRLRD